MPRLIFCEPDGNPVVNKGGSSMSNRYKVRPAMCAYQFKSEVEVIHGLRLILMVKPKGEK